MHIELDNPKIGIRIDKKHCDGFQDFYNITQGRKNTGCTISKCKETGICTFYNGGSFCISLPFGQKTIKAFTREDVLENARVAYSTYKKGMEIIEEDPKRYRLLAMFLEKM